MAKFSNFVTPISALTAWQGLLERARLTGGERVLIHGSTGAVGLFAVQLAHWCGATIFATASAHNLEFVRGLGADTVIDYHAGRFEEAAREMDVVFDTVGGDTHDRSLGVLKPGGQVVTIAASVEGTSDSRNRAAFFIVRTDREQLNEISRLLDAGQLRPVVDSVYSLAQTRQAFEQKPAHGKVVISVADCANAH